jgi:hypothetical protein
MKKKLVMLLVCTIPAVNAADNIEQIHIRVLANDAAPVEACVHKFGAPRDTRNYPSRTVVNLEDKIEFQVEDAAPLPGAIEKHRVLRGTRFNASAIRQVVIEAGNGVTADVFFEPGEGPFSFRDLELRNIRFVNICGGRNVGFEKLVATSEEPVSLSSIGSFWVDRPDRPYPCGAYMVTKGGVVPFSLRECVKYVPPPSDEPMVGGRDGPVKLSQVLQAHCNLDTGISAFELWAVGAIKNKKLEGGSCRFYNRDEAVSALVLLSEKVIPVSDRTSATGLRLRQDFKNFISEVITRAEVINFGEGLHIKVEPIQEVVMGLEKLRVGLQRYKSGARPEDLLGYESFVGTLHWNPVDGTLSQQEVVVERTATLDQPPPTTYTKGDMEADQEYGYVTSGPYIVVRDRRTNVPVKPPEKTRILDTKWGGEAQAWAVLKGKQPSGIKPIQPAPATPS